MSGRTLIRGGCVLTLGAKTPNFAQADVLIDGGRVAEVGPGLRARDADQVDATDTIVMPGFVDTHRHVWKSLFRNLDGSGGDELWEIDGRHHLPDDVYAATLIGLLGALEAGITTVVDWSDLPLDAGCTDAALQAHTDAGVRTVFVCAAPRWAEAEPDLSSALRRLASGRVSAIGAETTLAFGSADPEPGGLDRLADAWATARDLGLRIHAHAGSRASRGAVSGLARRGLLGADVTLVHCTGLDDADLDAIAESKAAVSLTPSSDMAGGLGTPPVQRLIDRAIRPGLGVDDERFSPGDAFAQMRATISLQHATYFDLKLAGKAGLPNLLTTREVIRYATVDGARAAGLGEITGSLEPGKRADILVLRTDRPNIFPVNDPIGAVVWGMDTSNVDSVFVEGRPMVRGGVLLADTARARRLAIDAHQRVMAAAGIGSGHKTGPRQ